MACLGNAVQTGRRLVPLLGSGYLIFLAINHSIHAQSAAAEQIVITAPEIPSAYGAPGGFSQSRFSPITKCGLRGEAFQTNSSGIALEDYTRGGTEFTIAKFKTPGH